MAYMAPKIIDLLDRMGVPFNRTPEGFRDQRRFGAGEVDPAWASLDVASVVGAAAAGGVPGGADRADPAVHTAGAVGPAVRLLPDGIRRGVPAVPGDATGRAADGAVAGASDPASEQGTAGQA